MRNTMETCYATLIVCAVKKTAKKLPAPPQHACFYAIDHRVPGT